MIALVAIALIVLVLVLLSAIVWTIASRPVRTTSELVAEAQLLVAGAGILISGVLAGTTIYYARLSRDLVIETRKARIAEQDYRDNLVRQQAHQELTAACSALVGSASDVIALGSVLALLIRRHRIWRIRRAELTMQPVVAASQALDRMRYLASAEVIDVAHELFNLIIEYFRAASSGSNEAELVELAGGMNSAKARLSELIASQQQNEAGRKV